MMPQSRSPRYEADLFGMFIFGVGVAWLSQRTNYVHAACTECITRVYHSIMLMQCCASIHGTRFKWRSYWLEQFLNNMFAGMTLHVTNKLHVLNTKNGRGGGFCMMGLIVCESRCSPNYSASYNESIL